MKLQSLLNSIESDEKKELPQISIGDTVRISVLLQEKEEEIEKKKKNNQLEQRKEKEKGKKDEEKVRIQMFEGNVIAQHKAGINSTITVRKLSHGVGVERVFLVYSPLILNIKVERHGQVRKAKLYYLRDRVGKGTKLKERFIK